MVLGDFKIRNIFSNLRDYLSEINENRSFIVYAVFVFGIMLISFVLTWIYSVISSEKQNIENARYLLSAVIQSLAAILAIVVTITFVSVQLASQTYSSRVTKIFTHSNKFWYLFLLFAMGIFSSLYLLTFLKTETAYFSSLAAIALTAGCLYVLGEYVREVPKLLSLEFLLSESFRKIDRKFLEYLRKNGKPKGEEIELDIPESRDPLLLYFDILINAIKRKDLATIRSSNILLQSDVRHKIAVGVINKDNEKFVSVYYLEHLSKILKLELDARDIDATEYTYGTLEYIGKVACGHGLEEFLKGIWKVISVNEALNLEKNNPPNFSAIGVLDSLVKCLITESYSDDLVYFYISVIFSITSGANERGYSYFLPFGLVKLEYIKVELTKKKEDFPHSLEKIDQSIDELKELERKT